MRTHVLLLVCITASACLVGCKSTHTPAPQAMPVNTAAPATAPALAAATQEVEFTPKGVFAWQPVYEDDFNAATTSSSMQSNQLGAMAVEARSGRNLVIYLARAEPANEELRVVFIDDKGDRHIGNNSGMARSRRAGIFRFTSPDSCPRGTIRKFVFEQRVPVTDPALLKLSPVSPPEIGKSYTFALPAIDSVQIQNGSLVGKVVVIGFGATWCGPYINEIPRLKALHERYHSQGLEIVSVNMAEGAAQVAEFAREKQIPWRQAVLTEDQAEAATAVTKMASMPYFLVIDRQGNLHSADVRDRLEDVVSELVAGTTAATPPAAR